MTTIDPLPSLPTTESPERFGPRGDAYLGALPDFVTQVNAVHDESVTAQSQSESAATLAERAVARINGVLAAQMWASGTTYALDDCVWSPTDYHTYLRIVAGAGTTDPMLDAANWRRITAQLSSARLGSPTLSDPSITGGLTADALSAGMLTVSPVMYERHAAVASTDIDCSAGNWFSKTISANTTFTISNVPEGFYSMILLLKNAGNYTVNFPAGVKWCKGVAPKYARNDCRDVIGLWTVDGGTTWTASRVALGLPA